MRKSIHNESLRKQSTKCIVCVDEGKVQAELSEGASGACDIPKDELKYEG